MWPHSLNFSLCATFVLLRLPPCAAQAHAMEERGARGATPGYLDLRRSAGRACGCVQHGVLTVVLSAAPDGGGPALTIPPCGLPDHLPAVTWRRLSPSTKETGLQRITPTSKGKGRCSIRIFSQFKYESSASLNLCIFQACIHTPAVPCKQACKDW